MKSLANEKNVPPNVFFTNTNTIHRTLLLIFLMLFQNQNLFSKNNVACSLFEKTKIGSVIHVKRANGELILPFTFSRSTLLDSIVISSVLKTSYCTGEASSIVINTSGNFNTGNLFSIQLSDKNGSFLNPTTIDTLRRSTAGTQNLNFKIPLNTPVGTGYRIRAASSNPAKVSANNGFNIQITTIATAVVTDTSKLICGGSSIALTATCSQGTLKWYDALQNGNLINGNIVSPADTKDYYASCEAGIGCASARIKQKIIVSNISVIVPAFASSCLNSDLDLAVITDEINLKYAWTGPNGFSSTQQSPTVSNLTTTKEGIYTVSIKNLNSCLVTATTSVSIGQLLQSLSVVGDVTYCYNGRINLTASTSISTSMNYAWTGPNGFTSTGQSISRLAFTTTNNLTTYHGGLYQVIASNSSGCSGTTFVDITVGSPPNVPSLPATGDICEGSPYILDWAIGGANFQSYVWTGPNNFTSSAVAVCDTNFLCNHALATIQNFQAINVGTYTIRANFLDQNNNSCYINAAKNVTLKPNLEITVSSNSAVCLGNLLAFQSTYSTATLGISSYAWTGPNNYVATVQNPNIITSSVSQTGVYKLTAIGLNLCSATATTYANVVQSYPPVVESTAYVVLGNSITLNATGCGGTLEWHKSADNQLVIMPVSPTVTTLYYANCNLSGCGSGKSGDITVLIKPPIVISAKTGNWEDKNTWDILRVPLSIDSVVIRPNHIVTINTSVTAKWLAWTGFGNLNFANANSKLNLLGNPITPPPVLASNPSSVVENISVTFTATGIGVVSWYKNGVNLNATGTNYTVSQPVKGDIYTAKIAVNGIISVASNAIVVTASPIVNPPVLASNPATVVESVSVTFTATGSGIVSWYKNGVSLNISGTNYTVNQPVKGDIYTAKITVNNITSVASNAIAVTATTVVNPPVLASNPVTVVENIPATFTASGSGVISWYKNGVNLNVNGTDYTVNQPVSGDVYTTKQTVNGTTSDLSNALTVTSTNSNVTITVPNKPPYYFSDGHPPSYYDGNVNSPAIFTNQPRYDPVNDMVWLTNNKIKIGINLKRGGQLAWASLANASTNLVYNGYDGGFQVTLDAYQRKDGYSQGGEVAGSGNPGMPVSYNAIQGGDYLNNAVSLIDYHTVPNGYYVKLRPIHYPLSAKLSQTYIEATYTLIGRSVKIEYRYTSFRTDGQWNGGGFDGAGAPSCFIVNTLNKYKTFTGNSPWSFLPTQGGNLPISNLGQNPAEAHATENWGMVYDAQNPNSGIGVYNNTNGGSSTYFVFKQIETYSGNGPGTEFIGGSTFFQPFVDFTITDRGNYVKDITSYLMIGSELEIRSEVYKFTGHQANIPRF